MYAFTQQSRSGPAVPVPADTEDTESYSHAADVGAVDILQIMLFDESSDAVFIITYGPVTC